MLDTTENGPSKDATVESGMKMHRSVMSLLVVCGLLYVVYAFMNLLRPARVRFIRNILARVFGHANIVVPNVFPRSRPPAIQIDMIEEQVAFMKKSKVVINYE